MLNKKKPEKFAPDFTIDSSLEKNMTKINTLYSSGLNSDFQCKTFTINYSNQKAALFFYASAVDKNKINETILAPLLTGEGSDIEAIVSNETIKRINDSGAIIQEINSGNAVLFVDGLNQAYSIGVADFQHRGIEKADNESIVKGPKESFTESSHVNLSLIRKRIRNHNLIVESVPVGERYKNEVNILYNNDLVSKEVLAEVKNRLNELKVDSVRNIELLEQYIEEKPYSIIPTILYSERPDRAAAFLEDGYIVLLMENSSSCLILPVTFWSFLHSPEDHYLKFLYGNFSRLIRMAAFFITLFVSAIFVAISTYHSEMVPFDLLLAIAAARERVPFPVVFSIIMMEFAFELIREAGLRIPNPLGPTIGIVGALILGQAAVEANIISPIIVIVAALSGLSSFAIADVSFNYTIRLSRFMLIFSAAIFGIFGIVGCFLMWLAYIVSIRSFGVPFLAPLSPHYKSASDTLFRQILQKELFRPEFIDPKDLKKKEKD